MARSLLLVGMLLLVAVVVVGYGTGVLPGGIVSPNVASHEAAMISDIAGKSIDANLNGIIDKADSCLICGGAPSGGGGPPGTGGSLVDMKVIASRRYVTSQTLVNADIRGIQFPYAVPGNPSTSRFMMEGCYGGSSSDWYSLAGTTDVTIDWGTRRIWGHTSRLPQAPSGPQPDAIVSTWDVSNAQDNVNYASTQIYPSGSNCGFGIGCPIVNVNFATKTINGLPAGCNFQTATLASFS